MLCLASKLVLENCKVTCLLTDRLHRAMLNASGSDHTSVDAADPASRVLFVTIPDGLPADGSWSKLDMSRDSLMVLLNGIKQQEGLLESLVEGSRATQNPISCIVSDFFFPWVQDVADKFKIPRASFWCSSAVAYHVGCVAKAGGIYPGSRDLQELDRKLQMGERAALAVFYPKDQSGVYERLEEASHILVNTFDGLEDVNLMPANAKYIGPCLPADLRKGRAGNLLKEDVDCLPWLDTQEDRSVLFISFGSVAFFPPSQIEMIAMGVEASHQKFLWVARPDTQANSKFPEGFQERTKGRGLVISWAPQLHVLAHPAIGGFLTHCGWNSTLESIYMGVPMLCLPIFAEQPLNAQIIERNLGVGMGFTRQDDGLAGREEIERVVRALMEGDEGCRLRKRALELKQMARDCLHNEGGSSQLALASFLKEIAAR